MKICLLLSASLLGGLTTYALAQNPGDRYVVVNSTSVASGCPSDTSLPGAPCACENDCQIHWGTFPKGCLWDTYCVEKRQCLPPRRLGVSSEALVVLPPAAEYRTACRPRPRRASLARRGGVERERILSFDLFFELLGWQECTCCANRCAPRGSCCQTGPVEATPQWEDPPVPVADPEPAIAAPEPMVEPAVERAIEPEQVFGPEGALPAVPEPATEPGAPTSPEHEPDDPPPPLPTDPGMPEVPRNTIPEVAPVPVAPAAVEPASDGPSLSHRSSGPSRVLVAGRLSDFIQTR